MCGICGVISFNSKTTIDLAALKRMCQTLVHRGPDDEGYYVDQEAGLGMRRLSIIDLVSGRQPLTNEKQTIWLISNGEVYNYRELRSELEGKGHVFATRSDSEVIVHAYEEYGDRCAEHFNGMFAFAVWDTVRKRLLLTRDRIGIKPLFYWSRDDRLVFGSELKAVIAHPCVPKEIDPISLDHLLTMEYVPAPRTILKSIHKLPAGHSLVFEPGKLCIEQYWDVPFREGPSDRASCTEMLSELLRDAVRMQMVSDVPLGAFLSGGMDSSTVVACMREATTQPIRTFSIGFGDGSYNELPYARTIAMRFGTDHREEILRPNIADLVERLLSHLDEPLGDFSIVPTYLVSRLARQSVKVVLSGDGGDEVFGGYESYVADRLDRMLYRRLPGWLRQSALPALMTQVPPQAQKKGLINKSKRFVEGAALSPSLQHTRWMVFLTARDKVALYRPDLQAWLNGLTVESIFEGHFRASRQQEPLGQQQYVDIKTYLVEDILAKVDRMSMAASLEARVPLLDHRIVEFAVNLPTNMKMHRGQTKLILREAMAHLLPSTTLNRPKQGFSIPLKHWLCGPLLPLMTDLLSFDSVRRRGYFDPHCVAGWISEHLDGRANHSHRLWALMVFEMWCQRVLDGTTPSPSITRSGATAWKYGDATTHC